MKKYLIKLYLILVLISVYGIIFPLQSQAYSYGGHKWSQWQASYWLDIAWWSDWLITESAAPWNNACNTGCNGFRLNFAGHNARGQQWDDYNTVTIENRGPGALALTFYRWWSSGYMREADIVFNTYYPWGAYGEPNMYDVRNVGTHEFGHWLVLLDQYNFWDYWDTMYYTSTLGDTKKRTLASDDINGIRAIY